MLDALVLGSLEGSGHRQADARYAGVLGNLGTMAVQRTHRPRQTAQSCEAKGRVAHFCGELPDVVGMTACLLEGGATEADRSEQDVKKWHAPHALGVKKDASSLCDPPLLVARI